MTRLDYRLGPFGSPGWCRLDVYRHDGATIAIVTEVAENDGCSITNGAESIHAELVRRFGPEVIHVEHYGPMSYQGGRRPHSYDTVVIVDGEAKWAPIEVADLVALIGQPLDHRR